MLHALDWDTIFAPRDTTPTLQTSKPYRSELTAFLRKVIGVLMAAPEPDEGDAHRIRRAAAWKLCFAFPKLLFARCRDGRLPRDSLAQRRLHLLTAGKLEEMDSWQDLLQPPATPARPMPASGDASEARAAKAEKLTCIGELTRAWRTMEQLDAIADPNDPDVFAALERLHPPPAPARNPPPTTPEPSPHPPPPPPPSSPPPPLSPIPPPPSSTPPPLPSSPDAPDPPLAAVPAQVTVDELRAAIKSSPRASAPGPSGLRLEHLLPVLGDATALAMLAGFLDLVLGSCDPSVALPAAAREYVFGASITPLRKADGGIRPIAVGDILVRLAGRVLAKRTRQQAGRFFMDSAQPSVQLGCGVRGGADLCTRAISGYMQTQGRMLDHSDEPDPCVVAQLDFRNAFNTISRPLIRREIVKHFPSLLGYFDARYGGATRLRLRSDDPAHAYILSREGVQQGDPLGPLFFSLALHALLPQHSDSSITMAYVDDVHIVGTPQEAALALQHILSSSRDLGAGLQLNINKSKIWIGAIEEAAVRTAFSTHCPILGDAMLPTCSPREGLVVLGVPLGSSDPCPRPQEAWVKTRVEEAVKEIASAIDRVAHGLMHFSSVQARVRLYRACAIHRADYLARAVPPSIFCPAVRPLDKCVIDNFAKVQTVNVPNHHLWSSLVRLPLRLGGVGLTAAEFTAPLAYLSAAADALRGWRGRRHGLLSGPAFFKDLIGGAETHVCADRFHDGVEKVRETQPDFYADLLDDATALPSRTLDNLKDCKPNLQSRLSLVAYDAYYRLDILPWCSPALKARLLSQQQHGSSLMWEVIPSCKELTLSNEAFLNFVESYQCISYLRDPQGTRTRCPCMKDPQDPTLGRRVDAFHRDQCTLGSGACSRHDIVAQRLSEFLRAGGVVVSPQYRTDSRPVNAAGTRESPDLLVSNYPHLGVTSFVEVSITSPTQLSGVQRFGDHPLAAAIHREKTKISGYSALSRRLGWQVHPVVFESTGAFGPGLQQLLRTVTASADSIAFESTAGDRTWSTASFRRYWEQQLVVAFWFGTLQMYRRQEWRRSHLTPDQAHQVSCDISLEYRTRFAAGLIGGNQGSTLTDEEYATSLRSHVEAMSRLSVSEYANLQTAAAAAAADNNNGGNNGVSSRATRQDGQRGRAPPA